MHSHILFPSLPTNSKLTDRRGGQSGKIIAVINIKLKEAMEIILKELNELCGRMRIPKKQDKQKKNKLELQK